MPALFRIVQDDCPPIPEGVSPIVKDFLYHCFQKDANLRVSAKKLLKHPWMASARKQLAAGKEQQKEKEKEKEKSKAGSGSGNEDETIKPGQPAKKRAPAGNNYNYDDAVAKVQEWNEALKCMHKDFCGLSVFLTFIFISSRASVKESHIQAEDTNTRTTISAPST